MRFASSLDIALPVYLIAVSQLVVRLYQREIYIKRDLAAYIFNGGSEILCNILFCVPIFIRTALLMANACTKASRCECIWRYRWNSFRFRLETKCV